MNEYTVLLFGICLWLLWILNRVSKYAKENNKVKSTLEAIAKQETDVEMDPSLDDQDKDRFDVVA